ncbi:unnamed protein product [Boreogadus saida]
MAPGPSTAPGDAGAAPPGRGVVSTAPGCPGAGPPTREAPHPSGTRLQRPLGHDPRPAALLGGRGSPASAEGSDSPGGGGDTTRRRSGPGLRASHSAVTENIISKQTFIGTMPRTFNASGSKFMTSVPQRPSAHLTLRDTTSQGFPQNPVLHQSCRHVVRSWANQSFGAHLHNMTLTNGKLRVPQDGRYYLYSQVYFRYPSPAAIDGDQRSVSHQLVQCVYKKTSYPSPIQLLKGVGTKCWAPDAEYALHSVYQGGLFELRAGDELFVSVSSPTMVNADDSSSYFGAFRLDL